MTVREINQPLVVDHTKKKNLSIPDAIRAEFINYNGSYYDFYLCKKKCLSKQQQKVLKQWLKLQKPKKPPFLKLYCDDIRNYKNIRFHIWGQSEEGFDLIFEKFVFPGQTVLDPFLGVELQQ